MVQERITSLLEEKGIDLYTLSKRSGVSLSTLVRILNYESRPSTTTILALCEGFSISLGEFLRPLVNRYDLTKEEEALLKQWRSLSKHKQDQLLPVIKQLFTLAHM